MVQTKVEVALIRHGRTDWNTAGRLQGRTDVPLNNAGRADALRVAGALSTEAWHALYSSPLARAATTAQIIGDQLGLRVHVRDCLIERSYGVLEGRSRHELRRRRARQREPAQPIAGMEADPTLRNRAVHCLSTLIQVHINQRLLIVSHGGFLNAFLHHISQGRIGTGITQLANGSVTRLTWRPDVGWSVVSLNEAGHLVRPQGQTDR